MVRGAGARVRAGAAIAAQRTGVPLFRSASASRAWRLKSWDRFLIPKPFARVDVHYGALTTVQADTPREAAELAPQLEETLERLLPA